MNPLLLTDFYKVHHHRMYPEGTTMIYSNLTPRKSRIDGVDKVVVFGIQHFIKEYLINAFNEHFFGNSEERTDIRKANIIAKYKRHIGVDTKHIEALWDLGYLPLEIKALPEGTLCPIGVPLLTIRNTHPDFYWLTNYVETLLSCMLWQPITSATIAHEYKKILTKYAKETDANNTAFVDWQGHDFSMRGMSSVESAILSGMGHLLSFTGTDTIPAIYQLESSYNATGLIGASVPATEHSVMCMGTKEDEVGTFQRLLKLYPEGILSVVSDTWDLWKVLTEILPAIKDDVMNRNGKLVIRPDSGNPVDIICGKTMTYRVVERGNQNILSSGTRFIFNDSGRNPEVYTKTGSWNSLGYEPYQRTVEDKGVIELLWDLFGGTINGQGYKVLDPHIGAIYGDSITPQRAKEICERLKAKGFASTNIVLGVGSYTYQYNTRDTFGFAVKATYGEVLEEVLQNIDDSGNNIEPGVYKKQPVGREIFKDPITDDGTKKSKKGLLHVWQDRHGDLQVRDQVNKHDEAHGVLQTVFLNGKLTKETTLDEIRERLKSQL
jgi:nicotinamide phosphoribosyltransferase